MHVRACAPGPRKLGRCVRTVGLHYPIMPTTCLSLTLAADVEGYIEAALAEAVAGGVTGKETTPFLLQRINELSGGRSLEANIALIKNNAAVGAKIAVSLGQIRAEDEANLGSDGAGGSVDAPRDHPHTEAADAVADEESQGPPVVLGGALIDIVAYGVG